MLVAHAVWADDGLLVWAEDGDARQPSRPRRGRAGVPPHPFAAGLPRLAAAAPGVTAEAAPADAAFAAGGPVPPDADRVFWLPSVPAGPLSSPELTQPAGGLSTGPGGGRARPRLAAWRVPVLRLAPGSALPFLIAVAAPGGGTPGGATPGAAEGGGGPDAAVPGGTLRYFAAVARFADDLARRGRVVPVLAAEAAGWAARWRPVLTGADAAWARELAQAMPPLARALAAGSPAAGPGGQPAPHQQGRPVAPGAGQQGHPGAPGAGQPSAAVLAAALTALADASVRARLDGAPLLPARRGRRPAQLPLAERWAQALAGPDPQVRTASGDEERSAAGLAADLAVWHAAAQAPAGPARTCFRLAEPDPGPDLAADGVELDGAGPDGGRAAPWRVELALQSTDDPSLIVPAGDIWAGRTAPAAAIAAAGAAHPDELLLAGLGRAARLFPALEAQLRESPAPVAVELDTAQAFAFLRQVAPLLSGAGFGVLLPAWARRSRLGLKLTTRSARQAGATASASRFGMSDLVEFRYDLALGDDALDQAELERLAALKVPLVRLRGQWVELDEAQLRAALTFLERQRSGVMSAADAMLAGLRGVDGDLPLAGVDADGWLGDLLSGQADRRLEPAPAPRTFAGTLRPYQERGLAWLSFLGGLGLGCILADDMGLGKTVQILALLAREREDRADGDLPAPALLVCPTSLVGNWQREAARFTPHLRAHVHHGGERLRGEELSATLRGCDLVITTYGVAARDAGDLAGLEWSRVICDEAQNIKNSGTLAARAVRRLPAGSRIALTGTPVENRLADLWSLMEFASPGLLGPAEAFRRAFAVPIEREGDEQAAAALKRMTGPFILRRLKTDRSVISDLPEKLEMKVWCNLTPEQASLYQATVTDMMSRIEGAEDDISRRGLVLAAMARLKQVCNHPAHLLGDGSRLPGRSGKLARLEEICDEIAAAGEKALCFSQYAEFAGMLAPHLAARLGCPVLFLHGGTSRARREEMVARFAGLDGPAVFLLSLKAGGTGLNLTAANHVIHIDRWWNPAVEDQATDRAFRIGQRKDVQVRKFICVGTLEERIDAMIEDKKALAERIVGAGESWLADLSVAELRKVIELSPEAVSR